MIKDQPDSPRVVAWETTRRCVFRCRHCRGAARDAQYAGELTTAEGLRLVDALASAVPAGAPPLVLILTGGEPMARADIYDLAAHATARGLRAVMAPCGPMLNPDTVRRLIACGIRRISISLDGATAAAHDAFRGVDGAFDAALRGVRAAADAGLEFQINTTVSRHNVDELPQLRDLAVRLGAAAWDCFFLVPTGRGAGLRDQALGPEESERALRWIAAAAANAPLTIRTTCAPQMARVWAERPIPNTEHRTLNIEHPTSNTQPGTRNPEPGTKNTQHPQPDTSRSFSACMAGRGFVFVSHTGILQPCGFLDVSCGDLRAADFDFRRLYATSPVFTALRDVAQYRGKCGRCEFIRNCGGCRARAYAATGDYLAPEPGCPHGRNGVME